MILCTNPKMPVKQSPRFLTLRILKRVWTSWDKVVSGTHHPCALDQRDSKSSLTIKTPSSSNPRYVNPEP